MAWKDVAWGSCRWGSDPPGVIKKVKIFDANPTSDNLNLTFKLSLPEGREMWVDWGDGKIDKVQGPVTWVEFAHTYPSEGTYGVFFYKDYDWLTILSVQSSSCPFGGDIANFRYLVRLERLFGASNNTLSGDIRYFPASLVSMEIWAANKLTGNLQFLPRALEHICIGGHNRLAGDIATLSNNISSYLYIAGENTISDYSGKTWATCPHHVLINPVSPGGLSTSEVDQLLIDLAANSDWVSGDYITLQGANAPRSSASDDAVAALVNMGVTVNTN